MSKAWLAIPSARPAAEVQPVVDTWKAMGYGVALWRDNDVDVNCDLPFSDGQGYPGYAVSVNLLAAEVLEFDPECQWIVTGGDDTLPDPNKTADEIADECDEYFGYLSRKQGDGMVLDHCWPSTFGVMQPTGDRFAGGSIDRIAGSPWMGREWCLRANGGRGPFWPEFTHMFGDQTMKETAERLGVYWMRRDLTHFHAHFMRASEDINSPAVRSTIPPHLVKWNTQAHWNEMESIYKRLKAQDFAPCMPLPVSAIPAYKRNLKLDNGDPDCIEVSA